MDNIQFAPRKTNEYVPMTRRYPDLCRRVLMRDSKIAARLITAWDVEQDAEKVLGIFLKEQKNLSHERYWECLRTVWVLAGSVVLAPSFRRLLCSTRPSRHYFSTPEEAAQLRALPESFVVYRATNDVADGGLSWTLSKEYGLWYMERFGKAHLSERMISRKDVFALINRNNEAEIILL